MAGCRVAVEGSGCRPSGGRGGGAPLASAMETCCSHASGTLEVPGSCVGIGAPEAVAAAAAELAALAWEAKTRGGKACVTRTVDKYARAHIFLLFILSPITTLIRSDKAALNVRDNATLRAVTRYTQTSGRCRSCVSLQTLKYHTSLALVAIHPGCSAVPLQKEATGFPLVSAPASRFVPNI